MVHVIDTASEEWGRPLVDPLRRDARPWQGHPPAQLLAALAALVPIVALVLWTYVLRESPLTVAGLLLWPLLGGGCLILWLLFLHILVSGDSLESLGLRKDRAWLDLLLGAAGSLVLLALSSGSRRRWPGSFLRTPRRGTRGAPVRPEPEPLVARPVAGSRGLDRCRRLRGAVASFHAPEAVAGLGRGVGRWASLLVVSALFGLAHFYQGPAAVVEIGLISVPMGWIFMTTGRLRTLIVAHSPLRFDPARVRTDRHPPGDAVGWRSSEASSPCLPASPAGELTACLRSHESRWHRAGDAGTTSEGLGTGLAHAMVVGSRILKLPS